MRKSGIAAITTGVLLALTLLRGADLWSWRNQELRSAGSRAENLAFILAEYLRETFAAGDASLRQLAIHSQRVGGPSAPESDWGPSLASARAGLPEVGSISVTDAAGMITHSTQPRIVGQSRAGQYVFKQLSSAAADELVVDTPYYTDLGRKGYVIPLGRRLMDPSGRFAGTVVASFLPEELRGLFQTVDVGEHGVIWVFHPDGQLLVREPSADNAIGTLATGNPVFEAARRAAADGRFLGPVAEGGPEYISAFHRTATPPLYVAVSLNRDDVLAGWRRQAWTLLLITAVIGATTLATLLLLFRQMDARASALAASLEAEQRARRASDEANRLKEEFLMTVSHELRTPLQSILGWARVLMAGGISDPETVGTALETIERSVAAQTTLIDDLIDVSRGVSGNLTLEPEPADLGTLLRQVVGATTPLAEAKSIALTSSIEAIEPVMVDPHRLKQVIRNLIANAIKFTPDGGRVSVRLDRVEAGVEIVVEDNGLGIAPEFLPHVFERFRQADGGMTRRYRGLGLGLAIVRQLVELHGGSVTAESRGEGQGATFRVRLPVPTPPAYTGRRDDSGTPAGD